MTVYLCKTSKHYINDDIVLNEIQKFIRLQFANNRTRPQCLPRLLPSYVFRITFICTFIWIDYNQSWVFSILFSVSVLYTDTELQQFGIDILLSVGLEILKETLFKFYNKVKRITSRFTYRFYNVLKECINVFKKYRKKIGISIWYWQNTDNEKENTEYPSLIVMYNELISLEQKSYDWCYCTNY